MLTASPLAPATAANFRALVNCIRANGGTTKVSSTPTTLIKRGLVVRVQLGSRGAAGCKARYALTAEGQRLAAEMFPV